MADDREMTVEELEEAVARADFDVKNALKVVDTANSVLREARSLQQKVHAALIDACVKKHAVKIKEGG